MANKEGEVGRCKMMSRVSILQPPMLSLIHSTTIAQPTRGGQPPFPRASASPLSAYRSLLLTLARETLGTRELLVQGKRPILRWDALLKCWWGLGRYVPTGA